MHKNINPLVPSDVSNRYFFRHYTRKKIYNADN